MFPRMSLGDILPYAKRLVSKTHTAPQPTDVILMGVFGSKHGKGKYGMSAAKQYGLMAGDGKTNFSATDLAKKIASAPAEEQAMLCRRAAMKPAVFKAIFDTYHGDLVPKTRLRQRAADLNVHPDETTTCVELYVATLVTAGLASVEGEQVRHATSSDAVTLSEPADEDESIDPIGSNESEIDLVMAAPQEDVVGFDEAATKQAKSLSANTLTASAATHVGPRAVFNVNVTLDSSLDIEKLQKQLELLQRFGAI